MDWQKYVEIDPKDFRPTEVEFLLADAAKAREKLGWQPRVTFKELTRIMVDSDMEAIGLKPIGEGEPILKDKFGDWHQWQPNMAMTDKRSDPGAQLRE